jgi:plasmid stabilization system protein ParE
VVFVVNLTANAEDDLDEIYRFVQSNAPLTAPHWHARLLKAIDTLEQMPYRCSLAAESDDLGIELRELPFGKRRGAFRILFTISHQTVNVLHVRRAVRGPIQSDDLK